MARAHPRKSKNTGEHGKAPLKMQNRSREGETTGEKARSTLENSEAPVTVLRNCHAPAKGAKHRRTRQSTFEGESAPVSFAESLGEIAIKIDSVEIGEKLLRRVQVMARTNSAPQK